MCGIFDEAPGVSHRLPALRLDRAGGQLAADCVVEEESGILEALERRLGDETALVQAPEKRSADHDAVRRVAGRRLVEVIRVCVSRILADNETSKEPWQPPPLDFMLFPLVLDRS